MAKRILIKLSGEVLEGESKESFSATSLSKAASMLKEVVDAGYEVGVVLGGGNLFRGLQNQKNLLLNRTKADQVGMLATLMNGLLLSEALRNCDQSHKLLSALPCEPLIESYTYEKMSLGLKEHKLVIFVGGTGNPYFTTDSAAALRASEMGATLLLKATTKVDGIYNKDPRVHKDAFKYDTISFERALEEKLQVLDLTAFILCMENKVDIRVYQYSAHTFLEAVRENSFGSLVRNS